MKRRRGKVLRVLAVMVLLLAGIVAASCRPGATSTPVHASEQASSPTPSGVTSSAATATSEPTATPRPVTLRDLAEQKGITIGAQGLADSLDNPVYARLLGGEFNRMTVDFLWLHDRPDKDSYDFRRTDRLIEFARRHNMRVQGLHLVWGYKELLPEWLKNGSFSRDELIAILRDHVMTVATRYRGLIDVWSVVNEGLNDDHFWLQRIGPQYIEMAFRWARQADPNAVLIYNDYENEVANSRSSAVYEMLAHLKAEGVPVDGVGMQMHLLNPMLAQTPPSKEAVLANMRRFAQLGLRVYVTEFDVTLDRATGTQQEKWTFQAGIYRDMLAACLESGVCPSFSIYGVGDADTWYLLVGLRAPEPLPFDVTYQPKPAYYAMRDVLSR